jgi:translocator protein
MIVFIVSAAGAIASASARDFYRELSRPIWAPPGWLFGPVWTILYVLLAVAAWIVWRRRGFIESRTPLILYFVQLAFNGLWTWIFFVYHLGSCAFFEILLLWCLILGTIVLFWRASRIAGALLLPYLAWVSFAAILTFAVWSRNPQLL